MRIYLPTTLPALAARMRLRPDAGPTVADAGALAYGVTPGLREWYREGDSDELEYVALTRAATASLRLIASDAGECATGGGPRRAVLAADLPDARVVPATDVDVAAVRLTAPLRLSAVAALHADDPAVSGEVGRAAAVVAEAALGDDDARFLIDSLQDHELQWYAVQEIEFLLA